MDLTADTWQSTTMAAHGRTAKFFKPAENRAILDFITFAKTPIAAILVEAEAGKASAGDTGKVD